MKRKVDDYKHRFDILEKQIDDMLWFERLGNVGDVLTSLLKTQMKCEELLMGFDFFLNT